MKRSYLNSDLWEKTFLSVQVGQEHFNLVVLVSIAKSFDVPEAWVFLMSALR